MKFIMTFDNDHDAMIARKALEKRGIKSSIVVDPLEAIAPALSAFSNVALLVDSEEAADDARRIIFNEKLVS